MDKSSISILAIAIELSTYATVLVQLFIVLFKNIINHILTLVLVCVKLNCDLKRKGGMFSKGDEPTK